MISALLYLPHDQPPEIHCTLCCTKTVELKEYSYKVALCLNDVKAAVHHDDGMVVQGHDGEMAVLDRGDAKEALESA